LSKSDIKTIQFVVNDNIQLKHNRTNVYEKRKKN